MSDNANRIAKLERLAGITLSRGNYKLVEHVATSYMSVVYRALDSDSKEVAVKILLHEKHLVRFRHEADISYYLNIGNVATTIGAELNGENLPDGTVIKYLVMKWISGPSLSEVIKTNRKKPKTTREILDYADNLLQQIAPALDRIHRLHIIHRDIKPSNIRFNTNMLERDEPYLLDFGIAKHKESTDHPMVADETGNIIQVDFTKVGEFPGTHRYMPPEQWDGNVVPASDQYALALTIYELITNGISPYEKELIFLSTSTGSGGSEDTQRLSAWRKSHHEVQPALIQDYRAEVPIDAWRVLQRALSKNPNMRYRSIIDFSRAFSDAIHVSAGQQQHSTSDLGKTLAQIPVAPTNKRDTTEQPLANIKPGVPESPSSPRVMSDPTGDWVQTNRDVINVLTRPIVLVGLGALVIVLLVFGLGLAASTPTRSTPTKVASSTSVSVADNTTLASDTPSPGTATESTLNPTNAHADTVVTRTPFISGNDETPEATAATETATALTLASPTATEAATAILTATNTPTDTPTTTSTPTNTPTNTVIPTATNTPTNTSTPTTTNTPTDTPTPTFSPQDVIELLTNLSSAGRSPLVFNCKDYIEIYDRLNTYVSGKTSEAALVEPLMASTSVVTEFYQFCVQPSNRDNTRVRLPENMRSNQFRDLSQAILTVIDAIQAQ